MTYENDVVEGLVTTVIPVYNRPEMLRVAVDSVLAQTYRPIEILIVDDGSNDDTLAVARELEDAHSGVIRAFTKVNSGPGPSRELGRVNARGEFLQYLDSDDRLLPNKFESQVAALRSRPGCGIAYGQTRLVDEHGETLADPFKWTDRDIATLYPGLLVDRWWCTHTPLYRRSVTDAAGPWADMRWSQDWELDARIGADGVQLVRVEEHVSEHVHHSGERQTSVADWTTDPKRLRNRVRLLNALWSNAEKCGVPEDAPERQHFARWAFSIARQTAAAGMSNDTKTLLVIAEQAAGKDGAGSRGIPAFRTATRLIGTTTAGKIARRLESLRGGRGSASLPQSFEESAG